MGGLSSKLKRLKRILLIGFILLIVPHLRSQTAFNLRYVGITVHPFGDDQASIQPYKLDKRAVLVANFGVLAAAEHFVWEDIVSVKLLQGLFSDCSAGWAAVTHVGVRGLIFEKKNHRILFGLGPAYYYRQDWNRFPGYEDRGFFNRSTTAFGPVQHKLFWYACEFEYDYKFGEKIDFNVGFTPGAPLALIFSAGLKYWLGREYKKTEKLLIPKPRRRKGTFTN